MVGGTRLAPSGSSGVGWGAADLEAIDVGRLMPGQHAAAVRLLARAFRDNPLNVAVIGRGPAARVRSNAHGARASLQAAADSALLLAAHVGAPSAGGPAGVLLAVEPFRYPLPLPSIPAQLRCLLRQGRRVIGRWAGIQREFAALHPVEPHWYLSVLGVDPDRWHRGVGSALLSWWLRRVDADNAPSYLETDREENVGFYRRVGFEVVNQLRIMDVPIWCMWRSARDPARPSPICYPPDRDEAS